ncbi:MAG TPA: peptidoglycan editing factor PgeF [Paludibacteraceae bacterium]|nr:peptidoglycan editing factor PgeF [Paludibacteraceae bacterium]
MENLLTDSPLFDQFPDIQYFFTTRKGGYSYGNYATFNLSPFVGDKPQHVAQNLNKLAEILSLPTDKIFFPHQNHGKFIHKIDETFLQLTPEEQKNHLANVDGLYTNLKNVCISVTTADCVPLLFYDPVKKAVAVAHAGWRGTVQQIAAKMVATLVRKYGCSPKNIRVVMGPAISEQKYEVGKEILLTFIIAGFETSEIFIQQENKIFLNLWKANEMILLGSGVLKSNIEIKELCTFTNSSDFFSARRDGAYCGRMLNGIILR